MPASKTTTTVRVNQDVVGLGAKGDLLVDVERTDYLDGLLANGIVVEAEAPEEPAEPDTGGQHSADSAPAG
jgi:hypothetical protein